MPRPYFIIIFFMLFGLTDAQNYFKVDQDSLPASLKKGWKYNLKDDSSFALFSCNDNSWKSVKPSLNVFKIDSIGFTGFAWFRLNIEIPPSLVNKPFVLALTQVGASEIYLDGLLVGSYGKVSVDGKDEKRFNPAGIPLNIIFRDSTKHLIAVKYSHHKYIDYKKWDDWNAGFFMELDLDKNQAFDYTSRIFKMNIVLLCIAGFLFALTFVHLFFYIFYRKQKHHLYYSIFTFFFGLFFFMPYFSLNLFDPDITEPVGYFIPMAVPIYFLALTGFTQFLLLGRFLKIFWISIVVALVVVSGFFFKNGINEIFYAILISLVIFQTFRAIGEGSAKNKDGVKYIGWGFLIFVLFVSFLGINYFLAIMGYYNGMDISENTIYYFLPGILSIPVSISLYMARNFATVNLSLEKKLAEVEELSARTLQQEKEKQQILAEQNSVLEQKVQERTAEVVEQKEMLEEKQKEILDSIRYAKRIQVSLLPSEKYFNRIFEKLKRK
jgi:hypothetical protein